jgi:phosphoglycerate kinase
VDISGRFPTIDDVDVRGKRVLMRVDFNIPPTADGGLLDDYRLQAHAPGIKELLRRGARLALLTHRGRPQGQAVPQLSTLPLARALEPMLGTKVGHAPDCVGRVAEQAVSALAPGEAVMLENTRFHMGEQINHHPFVLEMAKLGDVFVNDAFATAHRPHASVSGLAAVMKPRSVLGPLMVKELAWLNRVLKNPPRPLVCVLGGAQVPLKLELIEKLLGRVDALVLGGAVAHTFLASRDLGLGRSLLNPASVEKARDVFTEAGVLGCRLLLPLDLVVQDRSGSATGVNMAGGPPRTVAVGNLAADDSAMDVGPQTVETWGKVIQQAGSVIWLGSLGAFEHAPFGEGTLGVANAVLHSPAFSLVAGDGLLRALRAGGLRQHLPHVSSGSSVLITALMGQPLPPLQMLKA